MNIKYIHTYKLLAINMVSDLTKHVHAILPSTESNIVRHRKTKNLKYLKSIDAH